MKKRLLCSALSVILCLGLLAVPAGAAQVKYDDTTGHWAESSIERWSGYNIVEGDNGHFYPDQSLTRGAMAKILANTLGLTDEGDKNPFADVPADAWYTPYVLRCYVAGIMEGDGVNANPDAPITRQETMTVLCRALNIAPVKDADLSAYVDGETVADWAAPYVAAMTQAGIIKGIGENQLAPTQNVTRGSIMAVLDRAVTEYINAPGSYDLTDKSGLVLVASGDVTFTGKTDADILVTQAATDKEVTFDKAKVTGSVTVLADNAKVLNKNKSTLPKVVALGENVKTETVRSKTTVSSGGGGSYTPTYTNLTIAEAKTVDETTTYQDVTITDAVGDGTVSLANMTILGNLYINGGGASTVNLTNVTIKGKIIIAKVGGERPRLNLTNTPVAKVEVNQPATIEADAASAVTAVQAKADVYVIGADTAVTTVTVPAETEKAVTVTVTAGTVAKVEAKGETAVTGAANAVKEVVAEAPVTVAADAVQKVEVPAAAPADVTVAVTGTGSVDVAVNSANGAAITTDGENGASVTVSTDLTTPPTITVDGTAVTHIHKWDEGKITTEATCTDQGVKTYTCTADGCPDADKVTEGVQPADKIEYTPALGHDWNQWVEDETNEGRHKRTCKRDETHIETAQHTQTGWVSADAENHKDTCTVCGWFETKPHHIVAVGEAVAADCLGPGKTEGKKCDYCNTVLEEQKTIAPLGHDFTGAWLTDADGHWHNCARCDATDEKTAHTYPADASCDAAANCTVCNYEKAAGTHAWGEWTKKDETDHEHTCTACGTAETEAHRWDDGVVTTQPTATAEGVKTYTCTVCKATKTETVPVASAGEIKLVQTGSSIEVKWSGFDCERYTWEIVDSTGEVMQLEWPQANISTTNDLMVNLPKIESDKQSFTFVLFEYDANMEDYIGKELGRVNNAIEVTVDGAAVDYTMAFTDPTAGKYDITLNGAALPSGSTYLNEWRRGKQKYFSIHNSDGQQSYSETTFMGALQDGDIYDLRALTAYTLEGQTLKATITPPSTKTYTAEEAVSPITLSVANNQIKVDFSGPEDCTKFGLYCYDSEGKEVGYSYMYDGFPDAAVVLPTPAQSGVYTLVIKGWSDNVKTREVARLENAFDIKIEGSAVEYTMSFDTSGSGNHAATLADTPSGVSMRHVWKSGEKTTGGGACSVNTVVQSNHVAQEGDVFDLRVITSYKVENNVVKVVMTPPSTKTYTAPTDYTVKDVKFEPYYKTLGCLSWSGITPTGADGIHYIVEGSDNSGTTWNLLGNVAAETKCALLHPEVANYTSIRIKTMDGETEKASQTLDMGVSSSERTIGASTVTFTPNEDGTVTISLTGLSPDTYFYLYMAEDQNGTNRRGVSSFYSDENGAAEVKITPKAGELENGYYRVVEFVDFAVSQDGKSASYVMQNRGDWTKTYTAPMTPTGNPWVTLSTTEPKRIHVCFTNDALSAGMGDEEQTASALIANVTLTWGNKTVTTTTGQYIKYTKADKSFSFIASYPGQDLGARQEGMTLVIEPASGSGLAETITLTNETFVYTCEESDSTALQDYTTEYVADDSKVCFSGLNASAYGYIMDQITNTYYMQTTSLDWDYTKDVFCYGGNYTDWANILGNRISLRRIDIAVRPNAVTITKTASLLPWFSNQYLGEPAQKAEGETTLSFAVGEGEGLDNGIFTWVTTSEGEYTKLIRHTINNNVGSEFGMQDDKKSLQQKTYLFVNDLMTDFKNREEGEPYYAWFSFGDADNKVSAVSPLMKCSAERGEPITALNGDFSFEGNENGYYLITSEPGKGDDVSSSKTVTMRGTTITGSVANMEHTTAPAVWYWDGNFITDADGNYAIKFIYYPVIEQ